MYRSLMSLFAASVLTAWLSACQADTTVGVYYYPWWGANQGGHTFDQTLRAHTTPNTQLAAVGDQYNSRDPNVIAAHIDQSHLGNISMWSMSWWGPNRFEDITIRNHILTHPRAAELSYTIHYETGGRLGSNSNPNYTNLIPDFQYLADNIFSDPNYMRIDGRPVVVMYLSRVFFDDAAGANALSSLRATMQNQYGYDPYIIGDHLFNNVASGVENFDAITSFDIYGQVFGDGVVDQSKITQLKRINSLAENVANNAGVDFVPGLAPGYNDAAVRPGHPPAARYLPGEAFGSAMEAMLDDAVLPYTDPDANNLILVNSFNEWHEDTQIEASVITPPTSTDDTTSGTALTGGRLYEGYGNRYLDILRNATGPPITPSEIRWGRGTAAGMFVGNYTQVANWNADDVGQDLPRAPGLQDRARVDRGGSVMTINSAIAAKEFLFGVDEPGQAFIFEAGADVSLTTNFFVAFNEGNVVVDVQQGATIEVGGNLLLGQYDGRQNGAMTMDNRDIVVTINGTVAVENSTVLGDKYGLDATGAPSGDATSELVDVLLDIPAGTLRTGDLLFAPNGDLATFLLPGKNNTLGVRVGDQGQVVIVGSDATASMMSLIAEGLLYTNSDVGTIRVSYNGADTIVSVALRGDFDLDGDVDGADFLRWGRNLAVGGLSDWQQAYGAEGPLATVGVPEPSSWSFAVAGAVVAIGLAGRTVR